MKKRLLCLLLISVMLGTLVLSVPKAKAYTELHASAEIIELIKNFEGFRESCYFDNSQRSVGYGTKCDKCDDQAPDYPKEPNCTYATQPITVEHATELLMGFVDGFGSYLNRFAREHDLTFTQNQFDGLLCLTYNCGGGWMYEETGILRDAVIKGDMGEYLVYAFGLYAKSQNVISVGHIRRRMIEAEVYLHGNYGNVFTWPDNLRYVLLEANGGKLRYAYQAFDASQTCSIRAEFTAVPKDEAGNDLTFAGWYTKPEGGVEVKNLTYAQTNGMILYAQWKNSEGTVVVPAGADSSTAVDVKVVVPSWWPDELYEGPGKFYSESRETTLNEQLHITKIVTGMDGALWGYCADGWIPLANTNYNEVISSVVEGTWYKITASAVNVRSGPDTSYGAVYGKAKGEEVLVVETQENTEDDQTWGKLSDGNWICIRNGQESPYAVVMDPQPEKPSGSSVTPVTVTKIEIASLPYYREYTVGGLDVLPNLVGAEVTVHYSNNRKETQPITRWMVSGFDNSKVGTNTVTVTCGGKTTTFEVTIIPEAIVGISVNSLPDKTDYLYQSETLDLTGATLLVTYEQNYTKTVPITKEMVTGFDNTVKGVNTLTVTYEGFTATFDVNIIDAVVTFKNYDGTIISQTPYAVGAQVVIPPDPVRPEDEKGEYVFTGWDKEVVPCNGSATYTATFTLCHTVTFLNYDGTVLSALQYTPGAEVTAPEVPGRPSDVYGEYVFDGWNREVVPCAGKATYTATYRLRYALGDLNRDNKVDQEDGIYLLWHSFFPEEYPIHAWADFDKNNEVNEEDGIYLLWHVFFPDDYPLR